MSGFTAANVIIAIMTFIFSVSVSMFVSGVKWGETRTSLKSISERLAKIEGMFEMKLKE